MPNHSSDSRVLTVSQLNRTPIAVVSGNSGAEIWGTRDPRRFRQGTGPEADARLVLIGAENLLSTCQMTSYAPGLQKSAFGFTGI